MYPDVFLKFADFRKSYGDVSALPTPAYYYGLRDKEEINVHLEEGKTLFVVCSTSPSPTRTASAPPSSSSTAIRATPRSPTDPSPRRPSPGPRRTLPKRTQVGAPMPGMVASVAVNVGQKVKEGETLLTLEAMKMFAAVASPMRRHRQRSAREGG